MPACRALAVPGPIRRAPSDAAPPAARVPAGAGAKKTAVVHKGRRRWKVADAQGGGESVRSSGWRRGQGGGETPPPEETPGGPGGGVGPKGRVDSGSGRRRDPASVRHGPQGGGEGSVRHSVTEAAGSGRRRDPAALVSGPARGRRRGRFRQRRLSREEERTCAVFRCDRSGRVREEERPCRLGVRSRPREEERAVPSAAPVQGGGEDLRRIRIHLP